MTEAVQIALIAALCPVLVQIVTHLLSGRKLDHITDLTNSNLTVANERIKTLEDKLTDEPREKKHGR